MPKEDYLLKYLEKLRHVIAAMMGLRDKGLPEEAIHLADETYREMLDNDIVSIGDMSTDDFIKKVRKAAYNITYTESLAKLTKETGDCLYDAGDFVVMKSFYQKSLALYLLLNEKDKTFSFEREIIISQLEGIISA
jgi:hypothetical protein